MPKEKSKAQQAMDEVQANVRPFLKGLGFRLQARAFNRLTGDGITQVIEFQMGRFDPPGAYYLGFRKNLYGRFTVNVGVYVPEVGKYVGQGVGEGKIVHEYDCDIRGRLGNLGPERKDIWWDLGTSANKQRADLVRRLERDALPFFERFGNRDAILEQLLQGHHGALVVRPRVVCAIILAVRGQHDKAYSLLLEQAREAQQGGNESHYRWVNALVESLGLGKPVA